jgi:hypothetical protein
VDQAIAAKGGSLSAPQGRGTASVVPASDLDLSDSGLQAKWASARALERGWLLCSYAPDSKVKLVPISHGAGGFEELRARLRERTDSVSYAISPATVDGRLRFVFLCYIGEATSAIKRGRAAMHSPHVEKFFDGTVGSFPVLTSSAELEGAAMDRLLMQLCKGAKEARMR